LIIEQKSIPLLSNFSILPQEQKRIIELEAIVASLTQQNAELLTKISVLEAKLSHYLTRKDSNNSSIPPSQDPHRIKRTESLREKTGRKAGGQPGHDGACLEMSAEPDDIVVHKPSSCSCCGRDLSSIASEFIGKRQVIDLPPVKPVITEHQIYGKRCLCGHLTESEYPQEAHSAVCYGNRIQGLTAYLHARQYVPFERMREMYGNIFGLCISSGTLVNMVHSFADKAKYAYDEILRRITHSKVVGADETGVCVSGKNHWAWVFQTPVATYIYPDPSRGKKVIDKLFPDGFPQTTLVHDCWSPYFGVSTARHQICTAHLLRELKYLDKRYSEQRWTADFRNLLHKALELKKTLRKEDYFKPVAQRTLLEEELDLLLGGTINEAHKKLIVFKARIEKYRNHLFRFLYHYAVPPDNNASERAVRTFKVKQKVSGLFRAKEGVDAFAVIRSVIDTTIKNAQNVWDALTLIPTIPVTIRDS
jgi:transposase